MPNQMEKSKSVKPFMIKLDDFKNDGKKKNTIGHFSEL